MKNKKGHLKMFAYENKEEFMKSPVLIVTLFVIGLILASCSTDAGIDVSIAWEDNQYFTNDADCYVAAATGLYSVVSGFDEEAFDQEAITPGTDTEVNFSMSISGAENVVVYVYYDNNGDEKYNDGDDLNGYENIVLESDGATVALTPYY